jgi:natural product precursor
MKLFKKKTEKTSAKVVNAIKLDKKQLETVVGGATEGNPIGGIVVKGGRNF